MRIDGIYALSAMLIGMTACSPMPRKLSDELLLSNRSFPHPHVAENTTKTFWILAGDSTTAAAGSQACAGGWGDAFLERIVGASGYNMGFCKMSTETYQQYSRWQAALALASRNAQTIPTFVLISFGINDELQNVSMKTMHLNLWTFVKQVRKAHAIPVLVTPMTRSEFRNNKTIEAFVASTTNILSLAETTGTKVLDLNRYSRLLYNSYGWKVVKHLQRSPGDTIHLNKLGASVMGTLMCLMVRRTLPDIPLDCYMREHGAFNRAPE